MAKKKVKQNKKGNDKRKIVLIIISIFIVLGILFSTIYNSININLKKDNNGVETLKLLDFIEVSLSDVVSKIENKEDFVLYIGYPGCQACESYSPVLKRVQSQKNKDTYYLNYKTINKKDKNWKSLTSEIDVKQKLTLSIDGKETIINDEIGNIMKEHGYTPVTVVFENGRCVDAYIGSMNSKNLMKFLNY